MTKAPMHEKIDKVVQGIINEAAEATDPQKALEEASAALITHIYPSLLRDMKSVVHQVMYLVYTLISLNNTIVEYREQVEGELYFEDIEDLGTKLFTSLQAAIYGEEE